MMKFIEKEKLSKKAKKELNAKQRRTWDVSPVSKKIESKKHYNRKSRDRYDDGSAGLYFFLFSAA